MSARPVIFLAVLAGLGVGLAGTARADRDDWGRWRGWGGPRFSFGLALPAYAPPVYYAPPPAYYAPPPRAYYPPPRAYYPPPPAYYEPPPPVAVVPPGFSFGVSVPMR